MAMMAPALRGCRNAALMVNTLLTIPFKLPGQANVIFEIFP